MEQKFAYIDSESNINFWQSIFKGLWEEYSKKCSPPPLINSLERFIQDYVPKDKNPYEDTFMQSGTKSEAAACTWKTHIFQFILPYGSLGNLLELLGRLKNKNFIPGRPGGSGG